MAAEPEDRVYGGNHGYADDAAKFYSWNSRVPNHAEIRVGDRVVIWDKHTLLGHSVVERINRYGGTIERRLCARCRRPNISYRKTKAPDWRCQKCLTEFDKPIVKVEEVVHYTADLAQGWVDLYSILSGTELRRVALSPQSQHAMREMSWAKFVDALASKKRSVDGNSR